MPWLKPPWFEQVIRLVDIIGPVLLPLGVVMLPYLAIRRRRKDNTKLMGSLISPIKIAFIASGFIGGDQGFDRMHIGILPTVIRQHRQTVITFIGIGQMFRIPEIVFQQIPSVFKHVIRAINFRLQGPRCGQHHKRMAIGHGTAIINPLAIALP